MLKDIFAAVKALWAAWREPPPNAADYEQYHEAKMLAESGIFDAENLPSKKERPVPELTPGQVAFHGGLTRAGEAFSLAEVAKAFAHVKVDPAPLTPQAEDVKTLLTGHGSEAYKALVRDAKILTPLMQYGPPSAVDLLSNKEH